MRDISATPCDPLEDGARDPACENFLEGLGDWNAMPEGDRAKLSDAYRRVLTSSAPAGALPSFLEWETWRPGRAEGPLLGGLLHRFLRIHATPWAFAPERFDGAILFLEDLSTQTLNVWHDLHVLRHGGVLDRIAGLLIGPIEDDRDRPVRLHRPFARSSSTCSAIGESPSSATSISAMPARTFRCRLGSAPRSMRTPARSSGRRRGEVAGRDVNSPIQDLGRGASGNRQLAALLLADAVRAARAPYTSGFRSTASRHSREWAWLRFSSRSCGARWASTS